MSRPYRILSIDAGGVRGLVSAIWLSRLEDLLGTPIYKHFDLVVGTSSGAVLAAAIASGMPANQFVSVFRDHIHEIFPASARRGGVTQRLLALRRGPKYDGVGLEKILREIFADRQMSDLKCHTMIASYNLLNRRSLFFKSWKAEHAPLPVWGVCKASASAPAYFPSHVMRVGLADLPLADGAIMAGTPAVNAIAEALRLNRSQGHGTGMENFIMLSVGTGKSNRHISIDEGQNWGAFDWSAPLIGLVGDGGADAADYMCQQFLAPGHYVQLQTGLDAASDEIDDADETNLNTLASVAQHYLTNQGGNLKLEKLVALLQQELVADRPENISPPENSPQNLPRSPFPL